MSVLLFRHVHAGDRHRWDGDDRRRPISELGRRQAEAVVTTLAGRRLVAVCTSPFRRCVESVEPLAAAAGLEVEPLDELAEGTPLDVVERLVRAQHRRAVEGGGDVVLCSHGDVIGAYVTALAERGALRDEPRWDKGGTWVVDGLPDEPTASYLPPGT